MAKRQVFERTNQVQDYLTQLEELLKKNRGSGTYEAYDVNPRAFRIGGKVVDPSGLGQDVMNDSLKFAPYDYSTIPMDAPNLGNVGQFDFQEFPQEFERWNPASQYNDPRYQEALSKPVETTQADKDQIFQETGKAYAIQQLTDGGILYIDGLIRYDDGTVREYTGQEAEPIASMEDGSVRYSDGTFRRAATPQEFDVQSNEPAYPIASQADGTVMYSDGIARAFDPSSGSFKQADSGVINFFNTFDQGYRFQPKSANDLTGQCAWFSQQITTLPDGSDWRIGNTLEQKQAYLQNYMAGGMAFMPGQEDAKAGQSIVFDEGTRYGHVATISEVFRGADGQVYYRLTESNYAAPNTVTHDRVVSANDPKILGIVKTVPREGYTKVSFEDAPQVTGERALQVQENASQTGEQERQQDTPEDKVVQEAPLMSQEVQPQQEEYQPFQTIKQAGSELVGNIENTAQNVAQAIQPMSPQRQELGQGVNELGQQLGLPKEGFVGAGEAVAGDLPAAGRELSSTIERANLTPRIDTGFSELLRGDVEGAKTNFADTLARAKARIQRLPEEVNKAIVPEASASEGQEQPKETLGQNIKGALQSAGQYVAAKAGEGIDALKEKASNLFQKTPLMGLFQGQKQVGDAKGSTLFESAGQKSSTPSPDAFFKFGGADQYVQYLIDNAQDVKGGALDTSLFKPEFYQDPNRVANVFGETSQGAEATSKYKDYLGSQIKSGFDQPYRTETKQEGDYIVEYKIPIQEYFQNEYFKKLISETPKTLKSGFSFDKFQAPSVTKSASEYKGEVPTKDSSTPIFKSGIVDLFKRTATQPGQLAMNIFKAPAPVYLPSQQSMTYEVPQTSSNLFKAPSVSSVQMPQTNRKVISQVAKPTLQDYLSKGKTEAQWYAETGQQSTLDAMNKAKAFTSPQAMQEMISNTNRMVASAPNVSPALRSVQSQEKSQGGVKLPSGAIATVAPANQSNTSGSSAQLSGSAKNSQSVFSSAADWIKKLFRK